MVGTLPDKVECRGTQLISYALAGGSHTATGQVATSVHIGIATVFTESDIRLLTKETPHLCGSEVASD